MITTLVDGYSSRKLLLDWYAYYKVWDISVYDEIAVSEFISFVSAEFLYIGETLFTDYLIIEVDRKKLMSMEIDFYDYLGPETDNL